MSPADPFVKQTSLPNSCVIWVRGSGVLYDLPLVCLDALCSK